LGVLNNIAEGLARRAARLNGLSGLSRVGRIPIRRSNRAARALVDTFDLMFGRGTDTADPKSYRYGSYYSSSAAVHAATRIRAAAVSAVPLYVEEKENGIWQRASEIHPLAALLRAPNGFWTQAELLRATETYLLLWGAAFWGIEKNETGVIEEVWPLRPDRMKVLPDQREYVGDSSTRIWSRRATRRLPIFPTRSPGSSISIPPTSSPAPRPSLRC
jgi:hypothetical protein